MIGEFIFLQSFGYFGGGGFGDFLSRLGQLGFFDYVLPFLIIFALVFGILTKTKIFQENKGINAIIAFAIGLMALQFNLVPQFFSELLPRLGIGLAIILAILVLGGLFLDPDSQALNYTLLGVATIIIVVVLSSTAEVSYWWTSWSYYTGNLETLFTIIAVVGVMLALVVGANKKDTHTYKPYLVKNS